MKNETQPNKSKSSPPAWPKRGKNDGKRKTNMSAAININRRDYYVTGITRWAEGCPSPTWLNGRRELEFDDYKREPIVCPRTYDYGDFTVTYLTCVKLTAKDHQMQDARAESRISELLKS